MIPFKKYYLLLLCILLSLSFQLKAQDVTTLVQNVKNKLDKVNDYEAEGRMKTNIAFLKVPIASVVTSWAFN